MADADTNPGRRAMSSAHKAALAQGRHEGRAVRRYLEAIEQQRPKRGRRRSPESITKRLATVDERLEHAGSLARLHLLQERYDLQVELARTTSTDELAALEKAFVEVAGAYGRRKGIGYDAWHGAGVSAAVLQRAGISRSSADGSGSEASDR